MCNDPSPFQARIRLTGLMFFLKPNKTAVVGAGETVEINANPSTDNRTDFHRVGDCRLGDAEKCSDFTASTAWGKFCLWLAVEFANVFHHVFPLFCEVFRRHFVGWIADGGLIQGVLRQEKTPAERR